MLLVFKLNAENCRTKASLKIAGMMYFFNIFYRYGRVSIK